MASKSNCKICPWYKRPGDRANLRSRAASTSSFQKTAIDKLKKHPSFQNYGDNQLAIEARDLTDPESIMNMYFSNIIYHPVDVRVDEKMEEEDTQMLTSLESAASKDRSLWRVEDTARFEVKLLLRRIDTSMPRFTNRAASLLQMQYGPLHTSLLINDELLLEWNSSSLVVPERYDGTNPRYPIVTSAVRRQSTVTLETYNPNDEVDLLFKATASKIDLANALIRVISRYNGRLYYDAIRRNCQTFVNDALRELGCENPPSFTGSLGEYYQRLKEGITQQPDFRTHSELDRHVSQYVTERNGEDTAELSSQDKEYLLGQYFEFHIREMTDHEDPDRWTCSEQKCQMGNLERHIDEKTMLLNRFIRTEN